jgi:hypothetical protein
LGHVRVIARTELRRRSRSILESSRVLVYAIAGLFGLFTAFLAGGGAFVFGQAVAGTGVLGDASSVATHVRIVRFGAAGGFGIATVAIAVRAVSGKSSLDAPAAVLTTVPHRDVLVGYTVTEATGALAYGLPLAVAVGGGLALGAGAPGPLVAVPLVTVLLAAVATTLGVAVGLAARAVVLQVPTLGRHRTALAVSLAIAYVGLVATGQVNAVAGPAVEALVATPIGWVGDLVLLAAGVSVDPWPGVAAVTVLSAAAPLSLAVGTVLAERVWFADPIPTDGAGSRRGSTASSDGTADAAASLGAPLSPTIDRMLGPFARSTGAVARTAWRRAWRAPVALLYVLYPAFLLAAVASPTDGTLLPLPPLVPVLAALACAWAVGSAFALNPFGDEGAVLAGTLTTSVSGRAFIRGRMLAGVLPGVPLAVGLTLATAILADLSEPVAVGVTVAAAGMAATTGGIAAGIGVVFPRFDAVTVIRSREAVIPSLAAFVCFTVTLLGCGLPLVATLPGVAAWVAATTGVGPVAVALAGAGCSVLATALAGVVGSRYAARRFEGYTL